MRTILFCLILMAKFVALAQPVVYQFELKDEIAEHTWRQSKLAMNEAESMGADAVLLVMNTYGGEVVAADSIRTRLLQSPIPVYVFIQNNAASAGALIALACDSIFMTEGSTIGAATVVNAEGEQVPDKYQSYMRKKMRATAESTGRNADVAEAMVDPDVVVEGVNEKGKVVTLTVSEAMALGFCEGTYETEQAVLTHCGLAEATVVEQELSLIESIVGFLVTPAVSGLLILVIVGGIYFELQSPGIGLPLGAAALAAALYFAPHYLQGLAAHWEILLFVVGIALVVVELFAFPGFGFFGFTGVALTITALVLSMIANIGLDFDSVPAGAITEAALLAIVSATFAVGLSIYLSAKLVRTSYFGRAILTSAIGAEATTAPAAQSSLVGSIGVAETPLRPSGRVALGGTLMDARSEGPFIEKGAAVKVIAVELAQAVVRAV